MGSVLDYVPPLHSIPRESVWYSCNINLINLSSLLLTNIDENITSLAKLIKGNR